MNKHWTETHIENFRYRITSDFLDQLIKKMKTEAIKPKDLAAKLGLTPGRISQILNGEMSNFSLERIIAYARALQMKVSLVAYEDGDPDNERGPIDAEIFATCWERQGKPVDFFELANSPMQVIPPTGYEQKDETNVEYYNFGQTPSAAEQRQAA